MRNASAAFWLLHDEGEGDGVELKEFAGTCGGGGYVDGDGVGSGRGAELEISAGGGTVVVAVGGGHGLDVGSARERKRRGINRRRSGGRGTVRGEVDGCAGGAVGDGDGLRSGKGATGRLDRRSGNSGGAGRALRGAAASGSATATNARGDKKERENGGNCGADDPSGRGQVATRRNHQE